MAIHPREGGRKNPFLSSNMNRRDFLRRTGLTAASLPLASAILAACGTPDSSGQLEGGTSPLANPARPDNPVTLPIQGEGVADGLQPEAGPLELYNWEEYINPRVVGMFEEQYGVKVNVNTFNTMSEAVATLTTTSDVKYDVFFPTVDVIGKLALSQVLMPLNKSYLPNLEKQWAVYTGNEPNMPFYDVGANYTVPYTVYTTGIAWRIDQPKNSPIPGPSADQIPSMANPYEILWDPTYKGKIHLLDDYREALGMALLKNGITDVNTDDEATRAANIKKAQDDLIALNEAVDAKYDVSDYTDLPEGVSLIHQAWGGDMVSGQYYFPDYQEDKDVIRYWTPSENMAIGNDLMAVLTTGNNPVLAHHFLNFMMDFDEKTNGGNSIVNFQFNGYLPPLAGIDKDDLIKGRGPWQPGRVVQPALETAIPVEEDFVKGVQLLELTPDVDAQWKDAWEAVTS